MAEQGLEERIRDLDFIFENSPVKIIANHNYKEIKLVGLTVGPFEEGEEYEVRYWVARELAKAGIATIKKGQLKGEMLDRETLKKKHRKMVVQDSRTFISLEEFFYPKARRLIQEMCETAGTDPEKQRDAHKAEEMLRDIIRCRKTKISHRVRDANMTKQILAQLTPEERLYYEKTVDPSKTFDKAMADLSKPK